MKSESFPFKLSVKEPLSAIEYTSRISEDQAEIIRAKNQLFNEQEKLVSSIHAKKNELESYIFLKKNQISDTKYQSFLTSSQKESILQYLRNAEDWIHQSDVDALPPLEQFSTYSSKLEDLNVCTPHICVLTILYREM
jgi:molecular chaperone DnaK (HSP70)